MTFPSSAVKLMALLVATAAPDRYFTAPFGWIVSKPPPEVASHGMVAIWQPESGAAEVLTLSIYPRSGVQADLNSAKAELIREEEKDGRILVSVRHHATCHGKQDGVDVNLRFGRIVHEFYHLAVKGKRVYTLLYTYSPKDQEVKPEVLLAVDSLCPP
jgi:hypothetical protein